MTKPLNQKHKELLQVRKAMNQSLTDELAFLERRLNLVIDTLIPLRDGADGSRKYKYRYVTRKMEVALGAVHLAQEKIDE
jgi:hypothetical protein